MGPLSPSKNFISPTTSRGVGAGAEAEAGEEAGAGDEAIVFVWADKLISAPRPGPGPGPGPCLPPGDWKAELIDCCWLRGALEVGLTSDSA